MPWRGMMVFQWNEAGNMGKKLFFSGCMVSGLKDIGAMCLNQTNSISESLEVLYAVQKVFFVHSLTK